MDWRDRHRSDCRIHDAPEGEYVSERDCDCGVRIAELEAAMARAHGILGVMSMGTEGHMRQRICTVYNIIGAPLGKGRSSHGREHDEP